MHCLPNQPKYPLFFLTHFVALLSVVLQGVWKETNGMKWVNRRRISNDNSVKVFKNGPSKICGRHPLKNLKCYGLLRQTISLKFFKGCLPQILLGPFLNNVIHLKLNIFNIGKFLHKRRNFTRIPGHAENL